MPLSSTGFRAYTIDELRTQFQTTYETESGETPDWDEDTFFGSFGEAVIATLRDLSLGQQQLYDAGHIDNATGRLLDARGQEHLVLRNAATGSRATVTVGGTSGTVIPAGKVVESTADGSRWVFLENVTIPSSSAIVECEEKGAVAAPAGTLTEIVTPVAGWTSVTNAAAATLGTPRETDAAYRARIIKNSSVLQGRTAPALISAVEALDFITAAGVYNNTTPADVTVGAFTVPAHGHLLLIDPATSTLTTAEKETLAQTIFETIGYGTQQGGSETESYTYRGKDYPQYWDDATATDVHVDVVATIETGYVFADVADEIETAVSTYINGLTTGQDVLLLGVFGAIATVDGVVSATVTIEDSAADFAIADTAVAAYDEGNSTYTETP